VKNMKTFGIIVAVDVTLMPHPAVYQIAAAETNND